MDYRERDELLKLLRQKSYRQAPEGQHFKLASGKTSKFFIDVKMTALSSYGHYLLGEALGDKMFEVFGYEVDAVAGVELGGCPLASAVAYASADFDHAVNALYVRKAPKDHGTKKLVEGELRPGLRVVLLEDVVTTGGSSLRALEALKHAECKVLGVLAVVDRLEGAQEAFKAAGVEFASLFKITDLAR